MASTAFDSVGRFLSDRFIAYLAYYLNFKLSYQVSEEAIRVKGVFRDIVYAKKDLAFIELDKVNINLFKKGSGLMFFSGLMHGQFFERRLGRVGMHGSSRTPQALILHLKTGNPVIITPDKLEDFISYLIAWDYPFKA
ncbi:MAG: PH domain-containing protein [Deinococcales bacterium]